MVAALQAAVQSNTLPACAWQILSTSNSYTVHRPSMRCSERRHLPCPASVAACPYLQIYACIANYEIGTKRSGVQGQHWCCTELHPQQLLASKEMWATPVEREPDKAQMALMS